MMKTMMVMMMVVSVSAGPLPPSVNSTVTEGNSTRVEFHQHVNNTEDDITRFPPNITMTQLSVSTFMSNDARCFLATCLTANLGSSLQHGDETAGGLTTDPFGNGKK
ncbi:uncharacterized protein zgc:193726 isoform X2 [Cebidichthys violaceus]|uniref:uncharacterized protein zgc:193726 isoform X2 n=1 Tax=Cebidichthys violaceus TaxID=271503 RepID=UPI0035C9E1F5